MNSSKKLYRQQRGSLQDSLKTVTAVTCLKDILDMENEEMKSPEYQADYYYKIKTQYIGDESQRCGKEWKQSYYVILSAEHLDFCVGICNFTE